MDKQKQKQIRIERTKTHDIERWELLIDGKFWVALEAEELHTLTEAAMLADGLRQGLQVRAVAAPEAAPRMTPLKAALIEVVKTHLAVKEAQAQLLNARDVHDWAVNVLYETDSELAAEREGIGPLNWRNLVEVDGVLYLIEADFEHGKIHDIGRVDVV